jgi:type I restriction enzyme, R subunit
MMSGGKNGPEEAARQKIGVALGESGWIVLDRDEINLFADRGVAVREFPLSTGATDYLLFVDQKAVGALEAKAEGHTLTGVEIQARKYAEDLPPERDAPVDPLPFLYLGTGTRTRFTNLLDPQPRSRELIQNHLHRPENSPELQECGTLQGAINGQSQTDSKRAWGGNRIQLVLDWNRHFV